MKRKRWLGMLLAAVMVLTMMPVAAFAAEGYVEVKVTYAENYTTVEDGAARLAQAEKDMSVQFASLAEAAKAFSALYDPSGNYDGDYNFAGLTPGPKGPLYVHVNDTEKYPNDHVIRHPVTSVEFVIHGEVPAGSNSITLGHYGGGGISRVPDIKLTGADENAKISGNASITAYVAGGYASVFTENGEFTVDNIEFTATEGNTTIEADGSRLGAGEVRADTALTVQDCTFHNRYYSYVNDTTSETLTKTIRNNQFIGNGYDSYAYFIQGRGTDLIFEGNTITGYARGLNIHFESDNADVVIKDNDISTNSADCGSIQLTNAKTVEITDNRIFNPSGAAIRFYNNLAGTEYSAASTTITGNTFDVLSIFQQGEDGEDIVEFGDGMVLDFDIAANNIPDDTDIYYNTAIWPIAVTGENVVFTPEVRADGTIPVNNGENLTVKFAAADGFRVIDVKADGESVENTGSYTFENVDRSHSLEVLTEKIPGAAGETTDQTTNADKAEAGNAPKTGDDSNMVIPFVAAGLALVAMAAVVVSRRRHN